MKVSAATRARRRDSIRTGHQLPAAMANSLAWDVILACSESIPVRGQCYDRNGDLRWVRHLPVVRFRGHYYLADGNPWPTHGKRCRLMSRPDNSGGDLCITSDGLVTKWSDRPGRRWEHQREIVGVQDDVQPVVSLPVAGAGAIARAVRTALSGAGQIPNHEQLPGGIPGRVQSDHQPELRQKAGA